MREILFRGKRVDNGEWVYGDYSYDFDHDYTSQGFDDVPPRCHYIATASNFEEVTENSIGQFIGITDANKTRVFDGDILQNTKDDMLFNWLVIFHIGCFGIRNIGVDGYMGDFYPIDSEYFFEDRVVFGNIHDNPDLLK